MRKHKKMYYVAGMISAIIIPLLFLYYATPIYNHMNMRVLDIGLPFKAKIGEKVPDFAKIPTEGWNYKTINVKPGFDAKTEENFIKEINQLKENNVDQTGIRFQLSDKNIYADIVNLLNISLKTQQERYGFDMDETNSFYVLYRKADNEVFYGIDGRIGCGTGLFDMNEYNYRTSNFWNKLIYYSPKESYYLIFGFLMLIYCAMLRPKLSFKI